MAASSVNLQQEFLSNQMEERRGRAPMVGLPLLGDFSSTGLEPRQFVVHGPSIRNGVLCPGNWAGSAMHLAKAVKQRRRLGIDQAGDSALNAGIAIRTSDRTVCGERRSNREIAEEIGRAHA